MWNVDDPRTMSSTDWLQWQINEATLDLFGGSPAAMEVADTVFNSLSTLQILIDCIAAGREIVFSRNSFLDIEECLRSLFEAHWRIAEVDDASGTEAECARTVMSHIADLHQRCAHVLPPSPFTQPWKASSTSQ